MLEVSGLSIAYGRALAVRDVQIHLPDGETLGLIGESGCGKSTLALGLLGLLPASGSVVGGSVVLNGKSLFAMTREALRRLRWRAFAYVPQSAMNALDPVRTLLAQFAATARAHEWAGNIRDRAAELFEQVGLTPVWLERYPHQLSGGMRQRAVIALALLFDPPLLVADEPTTGLDVIVQAEIIELLQRLRAERGLSLLMVSHDLGVVSQLCRRIAVMYSGRIVEEGTTAAVLATPRHPYAMALRLAVSDLADPLRPSISIRGTPPGPDAVPQGCAFVPRCPFALERCRTESPRLIHDGDRAVACHRTGEAELLRTLAADPELWDAT